jgi:hypothetical protein
MNQKGFYGHCFPERLKSDRTWGLLNQWLLSEWLKIIAAVVLLDLFICICASRRSYHRACICSDGDVPVSSLRAANRSKVRIIKILA